MPMKLVSREEFIAARQPWEAGLTRGRGILGIGENWQRKKDGEAAFATHAFMTLAGGQIIESSVGGRDKKGKRIKSGVRKNDVAAYVGGKGRKTWFFTYDRAMPEQLERLTLACWLALQLDVPYGKGDIVNQFLMFFGDQSVADRFGVVCSGLLSILITAAGWAYMTIPNDEDFDKITPSDILNWMLDRGADGLGWRLVGYCEDDKFFIREA